MSNQGSQGRSPVVVFFHGGWWQSTYDLNYGGHLCAALKAEGISVWSVEYRRVGSSGGGWPTTFQDAAAGFDHLAALAESYPLDLSRVIAMGHSAGAHLAFWLAGRHHIEPHSPIYNPQPRVGLHGLISLAGAVDLRLTIDLAGYFSFAHDKQEVFSLMGEGPRYADDRYRAGNPGDLLPLSTQQVLIQGTDDGQIPAELPARWAQLARRQGDEVTIHMVPSAGHFDVVDPQSAVWPVIRHTVRAMLLL
ncbi:alpha/beta hydrolase [Granulicella arctica]|uniref:alpha/beta hydrolase n=1 Tax=Granulicella arctica TaxID=940613 RepID=UPI0021E0120D|nr:alpha/beta hydrolase [Granulicella arctica]